MAINQQTQHHDIQIQLVFTAQMSQVAAEYRLYLIKLKPFAFLRHKDLFNQILSAIPVSGLSLKTFVVAGEAVVYTAYSTSIMTRP